MGMISGTGGLHARVFGAVQRATEDWLTGLAARFVFASTLLLYYINSANTKVGEGLAGFFELRPGAYIQILGFPALDAAGGDPAALPLLSKLVVYAGTYAEFILPVLIVIGLFSRLAALGMMVFVAVQTVVDITVHQLDAASIGAMFDRFPDALIADQRLLWLFPLLVIVLHGPGLLSVDRLVFGRRREAVPDDWHAMQPAE